MREGERKRVEGLILKRRFREALTIVEAATRSDADDAEAERLTVHILRMTGRHCEAMAAVNDALARQGLTPVHRAMLSYERGMLQMANGDCEAALRTFRTGIADHGSDVDLHSGACIAAFRLGKEDLAVGHRHTILRLRDEEAAGAGLDVILTKRPKPFDPTARARNIVAYSLFGTDPFYRECAITNARMSLAVFPEFTARFYCGHDVPLPVLQSLRAAGAQVLVQQGPPNPAISPMAGTFWRFLAFDDPDVDVVLCRDVDSPVLPRERAAIDLWLRDERPFYGFRDHPCHAEPILAGLWGGYVGLLPAMGPLIDSFVRADHSRIGDQRFLRQQIWPRLRAGAMMSFDSFASLPGSVDFPAEWPKYGAQHVGVSWVPAQIKG